MLSMTTGTTTLALARPRTFGAAAGAQGTGMSAAGMAVTGIAVTTANRNDATAGDPAWDPPV